MRRRRRSRAQCCYNEDMTILYQELVPSADKKNLVVSYTVVFEEVVSGTTLDGIINTIAALY